MGEKQWVIISDKRKTEKKWVSDKGKTTGGGGWKKMKETWFFTFLGKEMGLATIIFFNQYDKLISWLENKLPDHTKQQGRISQREHFPRPAVLSGFWRKMKIDRCDEGFLEAIVTEKLINDWSKFQSDSTGFFQFFRKKISREKFFSEK